MFVKASFLHLVLDLHVNHTIPFSDHFPVTLSLLNPALDLVPPADLHQPPRPTPVPDVCANPKWNPQDLEAISAYKRSLEITLNPLSKPPCTSPDDLNDLLHNAIQDAAHSANLLQHRFNSSAPKTSNNNPAWIKDPSVRLKKAEVSKLGRLFSKNRYSKDCRNNFYQNRKEYKSLVKYKKKEHRNNLTKALNNTKNSKEFWSTIKRRQARRNYICGVSMDSWNSFYKKVYPQKSSPLFIPTLNLVPELETDITIDEINKILKKVKLNKATGPDQIGNEFYKALPDNGIQLLADLFNSVLKSEICPANWGEVCLTMIFKKGDNSDPANYRGMALVNHVTKIFTYIIKERLEKWIVRHNILPHS